MAMQAGTDQPVVYIQQVTSTPATEASNRTREQQGKCRGSAMVVFGGIYIVLGVIYLIYQVARLSSTHIFSGVWGGLFIMVTGCVAIAAGRTRLRGPVIALLAMSIICILVAGLIMPICLAVDIALDETHKPSGTYEVDTSAVLPLLGVLGFVCFLTTSILSCVSLCCSSDCCKQQPRVADARTQMVMVSPDGKIVPVQVINVSDTEQVAPIGSDYTPLQWRHDQHNSPAQPSGLPPPYSLHPDHTQEAAAARQSTTSGTYCEVLNAGIYLHAPPLGDEDGYEVMTDSSGQASGTDGGVQPRQKQPLPPPPPPTVK